MLAKHYLFLALLFLLTSNIIAQNVIVTLGGSTDGDYFDVRNNNAATLFRVNGIGRLGIGTTAFNDALNVNGGINCESDTLLSKEGVPVFVYSSQNIFFGKYSGEYTVTGASNSCFGEAAGKMLSSGGNNTFIGYVAGSSNTEGENNTFIGSFNGKNNDAGNFNTFVGAQAGRDNSVGVGNSAFGYGSGTNNETGDANVFIGNQAGYNGTDLSYNVFVGYSAGKNATGNSNVFIGYKAGMSATGSDKLYIDNSYTSDPLIYGDFSSDEIKINGDLTVTGTITELSDARYKTDIKPIKNCLRKIENINAVYYKWNKKEYPELVVSDEREVGVIAQDVEKVFPELVKTDENGMKSVNYAKLSAVLLGVVKEQQNEIAEIQKNLSDIMSINKKLEDKYNRQSSVIDDLAKALKLLLEENEVIVSSVK